MCMNLCVYVCVPLGCLVPVEVRGQQQISWNSVRMAVSYYVDAGNATPVLCKSNNYSKLPNRLSSSPTPPHMTLFILVYLRQDLSM